MNEFDGYFLWLCNLVDCDMPVYSELLFTLYETEFTWTIEIDENFADYGLKLRREYYESDLTEDWVMFLDYPCNVFEALIVMARKMDELMMDEYTSDRTRVWFWEFIRNLGLRPQTNDRIFMFDGQFVGDCKKSIIDICSKWMSREFNYDGEGSPFPLNNPPNDQRNAPIVYQLNYYSIENDLDC